MAHLTNKHPALPVPASYTRIIARELGLQNRDLSPFLRGTGITLETLQTGETARISAEQQMAIIDRALEYSSEPAFGLRLGRALQPSSHGAMGFLVLSSPTVLHALQAFADYLPLRFPFSSVEIQRRESTFTCTLALSINTSLEVRQVLHECFALMLLAVVEAVAGRSLEGIQIAFQYNKPGYFEEYVRYFECPLSFGHSSSTFSVPAPLANTRNTSSHSDAYAESLRICTELLADIPTEEPATSDRVRSVLLSSPAGSLSVDEVASALFMTRRTLQRRLDQEGLTYREVSDGLLRELALRHIGDSTMTVEAIATLLGYHDSAGFRKAFRRWFDKSPQAYRSTTE